MSTSELERLSEGARQQVYDPDEIILRAGCPRAKTLFVARGAVAVFARCGQRQMLLGLVRGPALLGDQDFAGGIGESFSVRTTEQTLVIELGRSNLGTIVQRHAKIEMRLLRSAFERQRRMRALLQFATFESTEQQLLKLLWDLGTPADDDDEAYALSELRPSRLSQALGVDRKTVARNLTRLVDRGHVEIRGRQVALLVDRRRAANKNVEHRGAPSWWLCDRGARGSDADGS